MTPASNTIHPPVFLKDDHPALLRWRRAASRRVVVRVVAGVLGCGLTQPSPAAPYVVELNDPLIGVNAAGISQPRADFLVTDPLHGDAPILWTDPLTEVTGPAVFSAFVDTGASGFAISALHVSADPDVREAVPQLDLTAADVVGVFTEIGVGGAETGDVTRPFGIRMIDGQAGSGAEQPLAAFNPYGSFNLWVRREVGTGEANEFLGLDPINLVGMPVIRQRRMWMTAPVFNVETFESAEIQTTLLAPMAAEPATNLTIPLRLQSFISPLPPGEVLPAAADNPLVRGVTVSHPGGTPRTGEWLFDTGAQSTILSFRVARDSGLIPAEYGTLAEFMADYTGPATQIGGIGQTLTVPMLEVARIEVATAEGFTLAWSNVTVIVADVATLDGVFGMNLLVPAVTPDPDDPLGSLFNVSPINVGDMVFDATDPAQPELRLFSSLVSFTYEAWRQTRFSAAEAVEESIAGPAADPDADGASNFAEFAFGSDPRRPDAASLGIRLLSPPAGGTAWEFCYRRAHAAPGVSYRVEVSSDLRSWAHGAGVSENVSIRPRGGREEVTERILAAPVAGRLYVRVAASGSPPAVP
jgi:hypothetical protein